MLQWVAFFSGMCALVYEIAWMRAFTPVFGLSIYSTTAVLCAFMCGLGIGSSVAPRVIHGWKGSPWRLYVWIELGIALGSVAIPFAIAPITSLYVAAAALDSSGLATSLVRFGLSFISMVAPTFFMGMTLPVLVHACRDFGGEDAISGKRVGLLYGLNTIGGAVGCLIVGFVLIERLGVRATILVTACLNVSLALAVLAMFGRSRPGSTSGAGPTAEAEPRATAGDEAAGPTREARVDRRWVLLLYLLVGLASFGYEMVWFRILIFFLQSATYSFSIMLTVYLMGIGLGSLVFARILEPWLESRSSLSTRKALGLAQMGIAICGLTTFHVYSQLTPIWKFLLTLAGADSWGMIGLQKAIIAGLVILPPTFLMGVTFPLMVRLYKESGASDARSTGHLYAANTAGAIIGTLVTGFVLFDALGIQPTMTLLASVSLAIGLSLAFQPLRADRRYRFAGGALAGTFVLLAILTPGDIMRRQFEKVHGDILFYREGAADITYVYKYQTFGDSGRALGFADGRGTSSTNRRQNYVNRLLAYSTMMLNPEARDVLVISMGCGNTASAYTKFPIRRLDIVDISSGPFEAASYFWTNDGVLEDPRVHTHVEDGRNFLLRTDRTYDIIELEPPTLHTDGVVNLYTREFYEIAYSKLNPGGVLSQWIDYLQTEREPSYMVFNTMAQRFPDSTMWSAYWAWWANGIKGDGPTRIDYDRVHALFSRPRVKADMQKVGTNVEDILAHLVSAGAQLRATVGQAPTLTDDRTIVDFLVPKLENDRALGGGLGYSSPLQGELARNFWADRRITGFPFHLPEVHRTRASEAIRDTLVNFPGNSLEEVLGGVEDWSDAARRSRP